MELLKWIQEWYQSQCDESWEHSYGIHINTLDNPGWYVTISLLETELEKKEFIKVADLDDDDDWILCKVENHQFIGTGDPSKLTVILETFKAWAQE